MGQSKFLGKSAEEFIEQFAYKLTPERREKFDKTVSHRTKHFTMVLEDLKDPHNISAVIRTCEVFGLQNVHVIEEINSYSTVKTILKGSFKWLDMYRYKKRENCFKSLKSQGYQIAVASTNTDNSLFNLDFSQKTAFYLGSETEGNHPDSLAKADVHFKIPQFGLTESMNVSVCAGVLMSYLTLWLEKNGREKFCLSPEEQVQLKADFYERSALGMERNSPIHFMD